MGRMSGFHACVLESKFLLRIFSETDKGYFIVGDRSVLWDSDEQEQTCC